MTTNRKRSPRIEEMPDRLEHMRKIALIRKLEHPEYAADDPMRRVDQRDSGYRSGFDPGHYIFRIRKFW
jgi:hypothetical protein